MSDDRSFSEIAGRLKRRGARRERTQTAPETDYESIYLLRKRILGVLIRDARLAAERTIEECAQVVGVTPETFQFWEYGEESPSLPQLEILAYAIDVPVSHFWASETLAAKEEARKVSTADFYPLRDRIIGALLRRARKEARLSLHDLAARVGIPEDQIEAYEFGQEPVPLTVLASLATAANVGLEYFLEDTSRVGAQLLMEEDFKYFSEMPVEMRRFVVQPVNRSYIELAMRLSRMSVEELRGIAEGILNITY